MKVKMIVYSFVLFFFNFTCTNKVKFQKINTFGSIRYNFDSVENIKNLKFYVGVDTLTIILKNNKLRNPYFVLENDTEYRDFEFWDLKLDRMIGKSKLGQGFEYIEYNQDTTVVSESVFITCDLKRIDNENKVTYWKVKYNGGYNFISGFYQIVGQEATQISFKNGEEIEIPAKFFLKTLDLAIKFTIERNCHPDIPTVTTNNINTTKQDEIYKVLRVDRQ